MSCHVPAPKCQGLCPSRVCSAVALAVVSALCSWQTAWRAACREDQPAPSTCPQNVHLRWMSEVSSSIYATPLITDLYSDGHKEIVVPSFVHYLDVSLSLHQT